MLMVIFHIGAQRYALDSDQVVEIVPLVAFNRVPGAPPYVAGLMQYRGHIVPVIDLCSLSGDESCRQLYSTRIMLVRYAASQAGPGLLGLLAERVTETLTVDPADLAGMSITVKESPYLGKVIQDAHGMILCVDVEQLLPLSVRQILYSEPESEPEHGVVEH